MVHEVRRFGPVPRLEVGVWAADADFFPNCAPPIVGPKVREVRCEEELEDLDEIRGSECMAMALAGSLRRSETYEELSSCADFAVTVQRAVGEDAGVLGVVIVTVGGGDFQPVVAETGGDTTSRWQTCVAPELNDAVEQGRKDRVVKRLLDSRHDAESILLIQRVCYIELNGGQTLAFRRSSILISSWHPLRSMGGSVDPVGVQNAVQPHARLHDVAFSRTIDSLHLDNTSTLKKAIHDVQVGASQYFDKQVLGRLIRKGQKLKNSSWQIL